MAGVKKLRKIQLGRETTAGTAVAATTIWRGMGALEDGIEPVFVEEDVGFLSGYDREYVPFFQGKLEMEAVPATFEQLPHILEASIKTATGTRDGTAGSGYVYAYTLPTNAQNTIKTYTLEAGDDQEAERTAYGFVESFTLEGKPKEAMTMQASWLGRQVSVNTMTTTATLPAVSSILFQKGKLYIDTAGGTFGGTVKSNTLLGVKLDVKSGWVPVFAANGSLDFAFAKCAGPEVTLDVTFEHDAVGTAEKVQWRGETSRLVRVEITGPALTTAGTYTYKTLHIDLAGKWKKFTKLGDVDGNDVITGTLVARYNTTAATFGTIRVVNELSALP